MESPHISRHEIDKCTDLITKQITRIQSCGVILNSPKDADMCSPRTSSTKRVEMYNLRYNMKNSCDKETKTDKESEKKPIIVKLDLTKIASDKNVDASGIYRSSRGQQYNITDDLYMTESEIIDNSSNTDKTKQKIEDDNKQTKKEKSNDLPEFLKVSRAEREHLYLADIPPLDLTCSQTTLALSQGIQIVDAENQEIESNSQFTDSCYGGGTSPESNVVINNYALQYDENSMYPIEDYRTSYNCAKKLFSSSKLATNNERNFDDEKEKEYKRKIRETEETEKRLREIEKKYFSTQNQRDHARQLGISWTDKTSSFDSRNTSRIESSVKTNKVNRLNKSIQDKSITTNSRSETSTEKSNSSLKIAMTNSGIAEVKSFIEVPMISNSEIKTDPKNKLFSKYVPEITYDNSQTNKISVPNLKNFTISNGARKTIIDEIIEKRTDDYCDPQQKGSYSLYRSSNITPSMYNKIAKIHKDKILNGSYHLSQSVGGADYSQVQKSLVDSHLTSNKTTRTSSSLTHSKSTNSNKSKKEEDEISCFISPNMDKQKKAFNGENEGQILLTNKNPASTHSNSIQENNTNKNLSFTENLSSISHYMMDSDKKRLGPSCKFTSTNKYLGKHSSLKWDPSAVRSTVLSPNTAVLMNYNTEYKKEDPKSEVEKYIKKKNINLLTKTEK